MKRIEALKQIAFEKKGFDGFLVFNDANSLYFTGLPGASCLFIPKNYENILYVYNVNYEQAKAKGKGFRVEVVKHAANLMVKIAKQAKSYKIKNLAVDMLSLGDYCKLSKMIKSKTKMKEHGGLVWGLREIKDDVEIEFMRKAGELTIKGMKAAYETLRPGIKEYEVAAEIEYEMRRKGSYGTAFETLVISGARSAFPHGGCTDKEIREGDLVVVDIGAVYRYYRSDMTRTLVAGKPTKTQKKIFEIVKTTQEKAFQGIRPRIKAKDIDGVARKVIEESGYGQYFVHSLGHGIGLEVHEPPTLNSESKDKLRIGNVITIEPGVYIVGFGGIRIEDMVLVQKCKVKKLTNGFYSLEAE